MVGDPDNLPNEIPRTVNPVAISHIVPNDAESIRKGPKTLPHGQATTEVIVHYAVPQRQRYLPIVLRGLVTMVRIGSHGDQHVHQPINNWLKSPEDGLRHHRSMDVDDVYEAGSNTGICDNALSGGSQHALRVIAFCLRKNRVALGYCFWNGG